jgi:hypothetical protein
VLDQPKAVSTVRMRSEEAMTGKEASGRRRSVTIVRVATSEEAPSTHPNSSSANGRSREHAFEDLQRSSCRSDNGHWIG